MVYQGRHRDRRGPGGRHNGNNGGNNNGGGNGVHRNHGDRNWGNNNNNNNSNNSNNSNNHGNGNRNNNGHNNGNNNGHNGQNNGGNWNNNRNNGSNRNGNYNNRGSNNRGSNNNRNSNRSQPQQPPWVDHVLDLVLRGEPFDAGEVRDLYCLAGFMLKVAWVKRQRSGMTDQAIIQELRIPLQDCLIHHEIGGKMIDVSLMPDAEGDSPMTDAHDQELFHGQNIHSSEADRAAAAIRRYAQG